MTIRVKQRIMNGKKLPTNLSEVILLKTEEIKRITAISKKLAKEYAKTDFLIE